MKNGLKISLFTSVFGVALLIAYYIFYNNFDKSGKAMDRNIVLTFTQPHSSLDPLDADASNNIRVARMLFSTPIHTSLKDKLESFVLESFSYSPEERRVDLNLKENLFFSDGTPLTEHDIALSITRMLYTRPYFPTIKHIAGKDEWLKEKFPLKSLPKGIKIAPGKISIWYDTPVKHPLFRFTLEIFGIIPSKCIDLEKNIITCSDIPLSGPYKISNKLDKVTDFVLRDDFQKEMTGWMPKKISFIYDSLDTFIQKNENSNNTEIVLMGLTSEATNSELQKLKDKYFVRFLPKSGMSYLLINNSNPLFKNRICRQLFADRFRATFTKMADKPELSSSSFWPQIVGGYIGDFELTSTRNYSESDINECTAALKFSGVKWGAMSKNKNSFFVQAIKETIKSFGIESEPILYNDIAKRSDDFNNGYLDIGLYFTGLWPLDPYGDAEMLFSPGMHTQHKAFHNDIHLQTSISTLNSDIPVQQGTEIARELNQYLFQEAMFNVYAHMSTFYASKNANTLKHLPSAVTGAYPWQVFHE